MKIAVIQHELRPDAIENAMMLGQQALAAAAAGASVIVLPYVPGLEADDGEGDVMLNEALADIEALCLIPHLQEGSSSFALVAVLPPLTDDGQPLGTIALAIGDTCCQAATLKEMYEQDPAIAFFTPQNTTDLQAEATLEYAIALSDSLAGLIVIAECVGAEPGSPGHGGSAIVLLGEVLAEALSGGETLMADVPVPFPSPEPREELPAVPPLLAQRLAHNAAGLVEEHGPDLS
jgi:predicted amidohydrolase